MLQNLWTSLLRALTASLNHLHERPDPDSSQEQNKVLSGSVAQAELGPNRKVTGKKRVKDGPIRKADSTEIPRRKYYRPAADAKTYRMNGQGQLQCQQDPQGHDQGRLSERVASVQREANIP